MRIGLVLLFTAATVVSAWMATINWRNRHTSSYPRVIALMGCGVAGSPALTAVHAAMPSPAGVWVIVSVQAVLAPIVMGLVVCMALLISDRAWQATRRTVLLLAVVPA